MNAPQMNNVRPLCPDDRDPSLLKTAKGGQII